VGIDAYPCDGSVILRLLSDQEAHLPKKRRLQDHRETDAIADHSHVHSNVLLRNSEELYEDQDLS
jgi:hypothetical protein